MKNSTLLKVVLKNIELTNPIHSRMSSDGIGTLMKAIINRKRYRLYY